MTPVRRQLEILEARCEIGFTAIQPHHPSYKERTRAEQVIFKAYGEVGVEAFGIIRKQLLAEPRGALEIAQCGDPARFDHRAIVAFETLVQNLGEQRVRIARVPLQSRGGEPL